MTKLVRFNPTLAPYNKSVTKAAWKIKPNLASFFYIYQTELSQNLDDNPKAGHFFLTKQTVTHLGEKIQIWHRYSMSG